MATWLIPLEEMTPAQLRAIELDVREHRVIFGPPGSGKTQVLLHRARYLRDRFGVDNSEFKIFVFTKVLREYIQSALDLLDIPKDCVTNMDRWCKEQYQLVVPGRLPRKADDRFELDFVEIRRALAQLARDEPGRLPSYRFVLVDEGQDLDGNCFDLMKAISSHVTVCMDHKQQIYDSGANEDEIRRRLGVKKTSMNLLEAFRCSPYITELAVAYIDDPEEQQFFRRQTRTVRGGRETPVLRYARDFEEEKSRLIDLVRSRMMLGERIAVLFPMKRQVRGFAKGLREAGIQVELQEEVEFSSDRPKVMTYHAAKGLTFDTVMMPRLVPASFPLISSSRIERLLFVGITRATKWVYMSTVVDKELAALDKIKCLESSGDLTVQLPGSEMAVRVGETTQAASATPTRPEDDMLGLL